MESNDDLVYLGTRSCLRGYDSPSPMTTTTTSVGATPKDTHNPARRRTEGSPHRARKRSTPPDDSRSCPSRKQHKQTKARRCDVAVPCELANKYVELGWTRALGGDLRSVFGFFDGGGRFHRRLGRRGPDSSMDWPSSVPIAHGRIEYRHPFRGLSAKRVRDEVLRRLLGKFGSVLEPGEI